jgi:ppGpp synthetase/RelA/SpoT-type nucleotidyltranferase
MPPSLESKAVNALGRRLAKSDIPQREDVETLARLQGEYQAAAIPLSRELAQLVVRWNAQVPSPQLTVNSRAKTSGTIVEKVRRGTRLSTMQDIFGFRVSASAVSFSHSDQDKFASELTARLPGSKTVDRRANPSHGYRAVHVVTEVDGFPIEVQIRTYFQDAWANQTEALADEWGRGIRYGLPPNGDSPERIAGRARVLTLNEAVSDRMHDIELAIEAASVTISREVREGKLKTADAIAAHVDKRIPDLIDESQNALLTALKAFNDEKKAVG